MTTCPPVELTEQETALLRHALGLDRPGALVPGPTRNVYAADMAEDIVLWEGLVERGIAFESRNLLGPDRMFHVTGRGKLLIGVMP